jgi:chorismate dehydratase
MRPKIRVGAVSYLNTRPLVYGFEHGLGRDRIELSYDVPSILADRLARDELDVALIPVVELARIPDLEIVPGLGIVSRGPARSVFLISNGPPAEARTVGLDPESRTTNALTAVLYARVWDAHPEFATGPVDLPASLTEHDAVVRIGDKALFEPAPAGTTAVDLGELWDRTMGLPFVYAVWAVRTGILDESLHRIFHESLRRGSEAIERIAADYTWNGRRFPELAREYLTRHIRFELGSEELEALRCFLEAATRLGLIPAAPALRMGLERRSSRVTTAMTRNPIVEPLP